MNRRRTPRLCSPARAPAQEFPIVSEGHATSREFGMLSVCPHHRLGTADEGEQTLKKLAASHTGPPATIWICRIDLLKSVRRFSPLADRAIVNPLMHTSRYFDAQSPIWTATDHPRLNGMRELRSAATPGHQLLACIDLAGDAAVFGSRAPSFEEFEWQVLAAVGADFKGIVYRGELSAVSWTARARELFDALQSLASDLAAASPIRCIDPQPPLPVSALRSDSRLFLVLLDPAYMTLAASRGNGPAIDVPLTATTRTGTLRIVPPAGRIITSIQTLHALRLPFANRNGACDITYRFRSGGLLLVCDLAPATRSPR